MSYKILFTIDANEDIDKIERSGKKKLLKKLRSLLAELREHPKTGTGKPEQLKHYEIPTWSRRISQEHRLVYRIQDEVITVLVLSAYGHYENK
jgi:toxin YoeB